MTFLDDEEDDELLYEDAVEGEGRGPRRRERHPMLDAQIDEHDQAQQQRERRAQDLFEQPKMRQALRTELARVVGAKRASAAAQLFIRDYARLLRKRLQSTQGKENPAAADLLQATARRFARHYLILDEKSAERLLRPAPDLQGPARLLRLRQSGAGVCPGGE